jgi:hypothetical protein
VTLQTQMVIFMIAKKQELNQCVITTILRAWLQQEVICGCKPLTVYVVEIYLVICYMIASLCSVWLQKLFCVCDCNYFTCVIATRSYLWLQNLTVSVWLKSTWLFGIRLQAWVVCDCKTAGLFVIAKPILCVSLQTQMVIFMIANKKENWSSVWSQLFCVCACNKKLSVVANFDCICVVEIYLVIWYMIASLG